MTAYLKANKPARSQYHSPRRQKPAGIIGVHTAENILDTVGPDTGAEVVADVIVRRSDAGSYHDLVDSDSIVHLVDYEDEAFHIATHGFNRRTTGVSFALKTSDWATMRPEQREAFLRNGARAAAAQARYHGGVPARFLTLAQALRGDRGFIRHGTADPERRTDPGKLFPEARFLELYTAEINGATAPEEDPDMPTPIATLSLDGHVWVMDPHALKLTRVGDPDDLDWYGRFLADMGIPHRHYEVAAGVVDGWTRVFHRADGPVLPPSAAEIAEAVRVALAGHPIDVQVDPGAIAKAVTAELAAKLGA